MPSVPIYGKYQSRLEFNKGEERYLTTEDEFPSV